MKRSPMLVILALLFSVLMVGCTAGRVDRGASQKKTSENKETKTAPAPKPGDFFPLTPGSSWEYAGYGNEYASFTREVLFAEGNRAQIKESNGGTVSASVFETTEDAVVRILHRGETYDPVNLLNSVEEERTVILKAPLQTGTHWTQAGEECEIIDTDAVVTTPAGVFDECIQVKKTGENDVIYEYYKEGVGLVKREFLSGNTQITSALEKYHITEP